MPIQTQAMTVDHQPSPERLERLGVMSWPIWTKEPSTFAWTYDQSETCYVLAGEVTVTTSDGQAVSVGAGDLVTFAAGLSCVWHVHAAVRKHYTFHDTPTLP
ncbi:MAG: cupin domain-containing protein [Synechococcales cyanobacterium]